MQPQSPLFFFVLLFGFVLLPSHMSGYGKAPILAGGCRKLNKHAFSSMCLQISAAPLESVMENKDLQMNLMLGL